MKIRDFYTAVIANESNTAEVRAFATAEIEKMDAMNEKRRNTPSKAAKENDALIENLLPMLDAQTVYTSSAIGEKLGVSTSKASAILRRMVEVHKTMKEVESVKVNKSKVKGYMVCSEVEEVEKEGE